jgi:hypothetical protein
MRTRRISAVLAALSVSLLGGGAIAVASAVSSTPGPQVVIPARNGSDAKASSKSTSTKPAGSDDPANHDRGDDSTKAVPKPQPTTRPAGSDDPANHDVGDDHSTDVPGTTTPDDGSHDGTTPTTVVDDNGGHGTDDGAGHDVGDDHGGTSGSGSDSSGSDSSGSGSGSDGSGHGSDG